MALFEVGGYTIGVGLGKIADWGIRKETVRVDNGGKMCIYMTTYNIYNRHTAYIVNIQYTVHLPWRRWRTRTQRDDVPTTRTAATPAPH